VTSSMSYSITQQRVLALVPKFAAGLALPCAFMLIREIIKDHKRGEGNVMLRAIIGVSIFEMLDAFGWFMSTWFVPKGQFAFAAGSQMTCTFQGFLLQTVIGAPLYNCALAFYFYLVVTKNKDEYYLAKIERKIHIGIISYTLFSSFLLLGLGHYNHIGNICWIMGSPTGCANSSFHPGEEPCERGDWAWLYGLLLFYIPLWICIIMIIYFNLCIYRNLLGTREANWFAIQSFLYCIAFCITWTPSTLWSFMHWRNNGGFYLDFLASFFEPFAAFWNFHIFLRNRPKMKRWLADLVFCIYSKPPAEMVEQEDREALSKAKQVAH
jgi:hypothetical protein